MIKSFKFFSFLLYFFVVICLSACTNSNNDGDIVTVYDSSDNKIAEFTSEKDIVYFAELVGNSTENIDEDNSTILYRDLPKDAKISFKYVFTHKRNNGQKTSVNFFVYENYPYITLGGIPVITPLTWELSADDNNFLQSPTTRGNK